MVGGPDGGKGETITASNGDAKCGGALQILPAAPGDLPTVVALFDEAIAWLGARGLAGQWGTTSCFALPAMQTRLAGWHARGDLFVARLDGELVGALALGSEAPAYVTAAAAGCASPTCYVAALVTARRHAGREIGAAPLRWAAAQAGRRGTAALLLDCWADNVALCAYYERAGFAHCGTFRIGDWRGQIFERQTPLGGEARLG